METAVDRGEPVSLMAPLLIGSDSPHRPELTDLALELAAKSAGLRRSLPDGLLGALADLVRAMNCYYSNLIEGHDTHPVDIERALKGDYSADAGKRDLQLEATAHIAVQQWLDAGGLDRPATATESIVAIHRRFCALMPPGLLWVEDRATKKKVRVVPARFDASTSPSSGTFPSARRPCLASSSAMRASIPISGGPRPSCRLPRPIIAWSGSTRFSTARPRGAPRLPCDAANGAGYRRRLVDRAGPRT